MTDAPRARDIALLDDLDALPRTPFEGTVWRLVREGRDPTRGSPSSSRWCDGSFEVLYTALDRDGALAEIHALLSMQPVFPSKDRWFAHALTISAAKTLRLADLTALAGLGVDTARYASREYGRTQAIANAAFFLGFDGLIAPGARWAGPNLVLFTDRLGPDAILVAESDPDPVDWVGWRRGLPRPERPETP